LKSKIRILSDIKERFMTKPTLKNFALALGLLALALISSTILAQVGLGPKLPGKNPASAAPQAASHQTKTPGAPSYTYTLLSFPGTFYTYASGINPGVTSSKTEIVGGYSAADGEGEAGFLAHVSGTKTVAEAYKAVNYPHEPLFQQADRVNDSGEIVGIYVDSSGVTHGYKQSGGKFTALNVPFAGAEGTWTEGLNNSGEIVGGWEDSDGNGHGLTLIGGTYASFDYPGAEFTFATGVIDICRKDGVPVVDQEAIRSLARERFAKLLQRPFRARMTRHIAMQDAPRAHVEDHQHIQQLELRRHRHHEIAGDDRIRMVPHECHPVLRRSFSPRTIILLPGPVLAHGSRRDQNAQLEIQLRRDSHLPPRGIFSRHSPNQFPYFLCEGRSARARLPPPEELESFPVPTDQRVRFHDQQRGLPMKHPRPQHKT
jgi:hypothetical protein